MESPRDRRRGRERRRPGARDMGATRGLLHDLAHEMTTLCYLVEAVRGDSALPDDSRFRLELLSMEISRLLAIVRHGLTGMDDAAGSAEPVEVRALAAQITQIAGLVHEAEVTVAPGPEVTAGASPALLWRVLSNLVENAARAAGPGGHVSLAVRQADSAVIEVTDDGPGFGEGPRGMAALGIDVVRSLLDVCGGAMEIEPRPGGGTTVRVSVPRPAGVAVFTRPVSGGG